jgi:hypothetical protein
MESPRNPKSVTVTRMKKKSKNDPEAVRVARVRQLWNARPYANRTGTEVLIFYGWLEQHHPDLLKRGKGDPYQHLKVDLHGLWAD